MTSTELCQTLADATELSTLIAWSCVRRACEQAAVDPNALALPDLPRVIPELEKAVHTFHDRERAFVVIAHLRDLFRVEMTG